MTERPFKFLESKSSAMEVKASYIIDEVTIHEYNQWCFVVAVGLNGSCLFYWLTSIPGYLMLKIPVIYPYNCYKLVMYSGENGLRLLSLGSSQGFFLHSFILKEFFLLFVLLILLYSVLGPVSQKYCKVKIIVHCRECLQYEFSFSF